MERNILIPNDSKNSKGCGKKVARYGYHTLISETSGTVDPSACLSENLIESN